MQQNLLSPPAVISVWLGTTSFIFVLNNTAPLNGRISAADGIQEENVKGVVRVNIELPLFSFKGKMHLFQEVFSSKLIFVNKFFSGTGRKNSITMPGTDGGPHLQVCREEPRVKAILGLHSSSGCCIDKVDLDFSFPWQWSPQVKTMRQLKWLMVVEQ